MRLISSPEAATVLSEKESPQDFVGLGAFFYDDAFCVLSEFSKTIVKPFLTPTLDVARHNLDSNGIVGGDFTPDQENLSGLSIKLTIPHLCTQ